MYSNYTGWYNVQVTNYYFYFRSGILSSLGVIATFISGLLASILCSLLNTAFISGLLASILCSLLNTAFISGLLASVLCSLLNTAFISGLLAGILCSLLNIRFVSILGIILATCGYIISTMAQHLATLIVGYGILGGKVIRSNRII